MSERAVDYLPLQLLARRGKAAKAPCKTFQRINMLITMRCESNVNPFWLHAYHWIQIALLYYCRRWLCLSLKCLSVGYLVCECLWEVPSRFSFRDNNFSCFKNTCTHLTFWLLLIFCWDVHNKALYTYLKLRSIPRKENSSGKMLNGFCIYSPLFDSFEMSSLY